jgi:hypothetical protein
MLAITSVNHRPTGAVGTLVPPDDIRRRPANMTANQVPPYTLRNQIYWVQQSRHTTITGTGSSPVETNFQFALSDLIDASNLTALFDQYYLHSVLAIFTFEALNEATLAVIPTLYTAIDYDSANSISTVAAIEQYQSVLMSVCDRQQSVQRYVRPCIASAAYNTSTNLVAAGVTRQWLDCDYSNILHFGIRSMVVALANTSTINVELVYTFGFRNTR